MQVNEPLDVGGTHVFLTGNGYAPGDRGPRRQRGRRGSPGPSPFLPRTAPTPPPAWSRCPAPGRSRSACAACSCPPRRPDPEGVPVSVFPDARRPAARCSPRGPATSAWTTACRSRSTSSTPSGMTQVPGEDGGRARGARARPDRRPARRRRQRDVRAGCARFAAPPGPRRPGRPLALVFAVLAMLGLVASPVPAPATGLGAGGPRGRGGTRTYRGAGRGAGPQRRRRAGATRSSW